MKSTPGALRLFSISIVARLPLAMLSIGLLVHARHLTGSFAAAGVVTGVYAVALGVGALLHPGVPVALVVSLAAAMGLVSPPLGACVRTVLPGLIEDPEAARAAY